MLKYCLVGSLFTLVSQVSFDFNKAFTVNITTLILFKEFFLTWMFVMQHILCKFFWHILLHDIPNLLN